MAVWLVVGLGNPGASYAAHRHNIGAMVVAELARRGAAGFKPHRLLKADVAQVKVGDGGVGAVGAGLDQVYLARSRIYMNESGNAVKPLLGHCKVGLDHLIVVHDELDLDFGRLRVKCGGGDNGHNGLKSIRSRLGGGDYYRVRCGIGRPSGMTEVYDWVLSNFARREQADLPTLIATAADAVECLIRQGLTATQQRYNN